MNSEFISQLIPAMSFCVLLCSGSVSAHAQTTESFSAVVSAAGSVISGSKVAVYAADATEAIPLGSGITDSGGNISFSISVPSGSIVLYAVASGGDDGNGSNSAIGLMSVLGTGSNYKASDIFINELTTIAAVFAMAQFLHSGTMIFGRSPGLENAALTASNIADVSTGGTSQLFSNDAWLYKTKLYTLANLVDACIGSSGASSENCALLFKNTTVNKIPPSDTIGAALNIALNHTLNIAPLYALSQTVHQYAPTLSHVPFDWLLVVEFPEYSGVGAAIDSKGDLWVAIGPGLGVGKWTPDAKIFPGVPYTGGGIGGDGPGGSPKLVGWMAVDAHDDLWVASGYPYATIGELDPNGLPLSPDTGYPTTSKPFPYGERNFQGIAIDQSGHIWLSNWLESPFQNGLLEMDSDGTLISGEQGFTGGGLQFAAGLAIDGAGDVWVANDPLGGGVKAGSISEFSSAGRPLSPKRGFRRGGIAYPVNVAVGSNGHLWVTNKGVTEAGRNSESISELRPNGGPLSPASGFRRGGINVPVSTAIDGSGNVWSVNWGDVATPFGTETFPISELDQKGRPISPRTGYLIDPDEAYIGYLGSIAIDQSGNVWISNGELDCMLELVGAAAPVKTPLIGPVQRP